MSEQQKALALASEYRPTMNVGVLHLWAADSRDELRRQHAEIERLREALKPFAAFAAHYPKQRSGNRAASGDTFYAVSSGGLPDAAIEVDDFHAATAALERKP